jgi:hypothetical protein
MIGLLSMTRFWLPMGSQQARLSAVRSTAFCMRSALTVDVKVASISAAPDPAVAQKLLRDKQVFMVEPPSAASVDPVSHRSAPVSLPGKTP